MKIKELHLRNIASIEKADIDFENDLNDSFSGTPASIFLISGDTGAGKSVILDGISMALYKKTPRIVDVANKSNNNFTDEQGDSISINSIEQYTRLGISPKDECYSMVVFEGNDGKTYHAKLTLGFTKSRTKDENGNYLLKHSTPEWSVKVGDEDWRKVEKKTGQPILDAVGLTFEQFGRMAMLAQGQFASFLTGDKKERESILEQLTNTERFTAYGVAIKRLYDTANTSQKTAQALLDAEKEHTLPAETVEQYSTGYKKLETRQKQLKQQIATVEKRIKVVEQIERACNDKHKYEKEKKRLEELLTSDEYKDKARLVVDWEATATERQRLQDMLDAQKKLKKATVSEHELLEKFKTLSSDLEARKAALHSGSQALQREKAWLEERAARDTLYIKHGEIVQQLEQYKKSKKSIDETIRSLTEEKARTQQLAESADNARKDAKEKSDAAVRKQQELERIMEQREALNPEDISKRLDSIGKERSDLNHLAELIDNYKEKGKKAETAKKDIKASEEKLASLKATMEKCHKTSEDARKLYEAANNRLVTMNTSLEESFIALRKRLQNMPDAVCPLCGQQLQTIHLENDFRNILTPIEKEQQEKLNEYNTANKNYNTAKGSHDTFAGSLTTKKNQLTTLLADIEKKETAIRKEAQEVNVSVPNTFDPDQTLAAVTDIRKARKKEEATLKELQAKANGLQKQISDMVKAQKPLDEAKAKAESAKSKAENKLKDNERTIERLVKEQEKKEEELKDCHSAVNDKIGMFIVNWDSCVDSVIKRLSSDAKEYMTKKEGVTKHEMEINKTRTLINTLQGYFETLLPEYPYFQAADDCAFYDCREINQEWTHLVSDTSSVKNQLKTLSESVAQCKSMLDAYYSSSGKTEDYLLTLSNRKTELDGARRYIKQTDESLRSQKDAITRADDTIKDCMQKLGAEKQEDIPAKDDLADIKSEINKQHDIVVGEMASIKKQLEENEKNIAKRNEAEKTLENANKALAKWDILNRYFGGTRFRTLVQTYVLRPLLNNANIYLEKITDRYKLTCSEDNDQLSILVHDLYNKGQVRSATILSGGERFMISLALSLALSSLNRPDMNVNILFIDEGFGTLDENNLNSVMSTLEKLQEIAGQSNRRVGIISHREELEERIPVKLMVKKRGEGRSMVEMVYEQ